MLPKHLSPIEKKALREFKQQLDQKLPNQIEMVRLYGSKARGDAGKYSDIDILVVPKTASDKIHHKITDIEIKNIEKYGQPLSVKVMPKKEYEKHLSLPTLFIQFVQKEGIDL